jgi:hypothetical protein
LGGAHTRRDRILDSTELLDLYAHSVAGTQPAGRLARAAHACTSAGEQ